MAASDHLWSLIRSLDKAEVDRFRRMYYSGKGEKANYIQLFDDLLPIVSYREKAFRHQNRDKSYMRSLPQMKRYLYDQILDALRENKRHAKDEPPLEFKIREWMEEAVILHNKMLYDQTLARLEKAESAAKESEFMELLLEILKLKRTHYNEAPNKDYMTKFPVLLDEIKYVGKMIDWNCKLIAIRDAVFYAQRISENYDNPQAPIVRSASDELSKMKLPKTSSIEIRVNFHVAHALLGHWKDDMQYAWRHYRIVFLLWRAAENFRTARPTLYLKTLNNYLTTGIAAHKFIDFPSAFGDLERNAGFTLDKRAESKQNSAYIRLQYYLSIGDWENCRRIEKEFNEKAIWVTVKMKTPRRLAFYLSFARFHFVNKSSEKASEYLQALLKEAGKKHYSDKRAEAQILNFLISVDWQKADTWPDADVIRNLRRFLQRNDAESNYYAAFLSGLGQVLNAPDLERKDAWKNLLQGLTKLLKPNSYESGQFLFIVWVESVVTGTPVQDILKHRSLPSSDSHFVAPF